MLWCLLHDCWSIVLLVSCVSCYRIVAPLFSWNVTRNSDWSFCLIKCYCGECGFLLVKLTNGVCYGPAPRSWWGCCEGTTSPFPAPAAPSCNEYVRCQSVFEFLPNGGGGTEKSIEAMMGDPKLWNAPVCVFWLTTTTYVSTKFHHIQHRSTKNFINKFMTSLCIWQPT